MSLIQRLVLRLSGSRAAEIERESRSWVATCPQCGHQQSYWDLGGVRYKATSTGKKIRSVCVQCTHRGMFEVVRIPSE